MITDYFTNTILIKNKKETVSYEDWIAKKSYEEQEYEIPCRITNLKYQDLQLLDWIADISIKVKKLYTDISVVLKETDLLVWEWKEYKVIANYDPQDKFWVHHRKYFIKVIE